MLTLKIVILNQFVEDKILNPEKLKQGGAQGGQSGMSQ